MYISTNFIAPYNAATDYALVFVNSTGRRTKGINVCRYLNSGVDQNLIWVLLEGDEKVVLEFSSAMDANSAITLLKNAIDLLTPKCPIGSTAGSPLPSQTLTIREVTVGQYELLLTARELTDTVDADKVQWYDVTDTNGLFGYGNGVVFRVLALHPDDSMPEGFLLNAARPITGVMNFNTKAFENTYVNITNYEYQIADNKSKIIDTNRSKFLYAINDSLITTTGTESQVVYANNSKITIDNCQQINCINCNSLTLSRALRSTFEGLVGDLSAFQFSEVKINPTSSIGKIGHNELVASRTLNAYIDVVYWRLPSTPSSKVDIILRNPVVQANAIFNFTVPNNFTGEVNIYDNLTSSLILFIDASFAGLTLTFVYDKDIGVFYYEKRSESTKRIRTSFLPTSNGQTVFTNVMNFIPKNSNLTSLYVNGQKQLQAVDFTISGRSIIWTNFSFTIEMGDFLELYYE